MSEVPESIEAQIEGIRRSAAGLTDYQLDLAIAETQARRGVAAAHKLPRTADTYNDLLCALVDVRTMRHQAAREIDDMTAPAITVRPLTADELAEGGDGQEPPC